METAKLAYFPKLTAIIWFWLLQSCNGYVKWYNLIYRLFNYP